MLAVVLQVVSVMPALPTSAVMKSLGVPNVPEGVCLCSSQFVSDFVFVVCVT